MLDGVAGGDSDVDHAAGDRRKQGPLAVDELGLGGFGLPASHTARPGGGNEVGRTGDDNVEAVRDFLHQNVDGLVSEGESIARRFAQAGEVHLQPFVFEPDPEDARGLFDFSFDLAIAEL
jgi:hypothetical protein